MTTRFICEIASCHNGDIELAKAMIKTVAEIAPGSLVKFQDWRASNVPDEDSDKKRYERYEFKEKWYPELIQYCVENGVEFLTSCFNTDRAEKLASYGIKKIKLASISLTNIELIKACGANFDEIILSTAMHSNEEVEEAIDLLQTCAKKFSILHCVANYPTKPEDANLSRIDTLKKMTEGIEYASVGFSDHALDLSVAKVAMAKGITYLEKHFSLSRYLPQTPHQMYSDAPFVTTHEVSIEPSELKELIAWRDSIFLMHQSCPVNEIEEKIRNRYQHRYGK